MTWDWVDWRTWPGAARSSSVAWARWRPKSASTRSKTCPCGRGGCASPLKALTPDEAEGALAPLYAHLPPIRVTDLLADVDRWTGFTGCFTHLTTGRTHDDPRAVLTAVLGR